KYRSAGVVSGDAVVGDVAGKAAIIIDDLISSGTTMVRAAEACQARGAISVYAAATHGVFGGKAGEVLANPALEQIVVTNTSLHSGSHRVRSSTRWRFLTPLDFLLKRSEEATPANRL